MRAFLAATAFLCASLALAQDNYEIQVYGAETVAPGATMLELHSNYTAEGSKQTEDGVEPTNHALHETVEITHGFNDWFETGFYIFTSVNSDHGWQWVGDHIRPRVRAPARWHWPVGVSLSTEFGYQRPIFSSDTWTLGLRPIIDQQIGRWYWSVNPALEKSFAGINSHKGFEFAPAVKLSYDFTKVVTGGFEYYSSLGPALNFDRFSEQQQQFFPAIDLNVSPRWELNFGAGVGVTRGTDHLIFKTIVGYRSEERRVGKECRSRWSPY